MSSWRLPRHLVTVATAAAVAGALSAIGGGAFVGRPVPAGGLVASALTWAWAATALGAAWTLIRRSTPGLRDDLEPAVRSVVAAAAALVLAGIWWGWPGGAWAPDELDPPAVVGAITARFGAGWFDLYPPGQFLLLAVLYVPALLADAAGVAHLNDPSVEASLALLGRGVSAAMAMGTLAVVAAIARARGGEGPGWVAAALAATLLPFVYYAKTANVDAPYVFWFAVSLLWFQDCWRDGRRRDGVGFAMTAAAAVATKDQAFALYLLPTAALVWRLTRRPEGWRVAATLLAAGLTTGVVLFNVIANPAGVVEHFRAVTGGGSAYRMVPSSLAGQWQLLRYTAEQLFWAGGLAGVALTLVALSCGRPVASARPRRAPLWAFALSYYVSFIAIVGYVYDRFLLPVLLLVAIGLAPALAREIGAWPRRRARPLLVATALVVLVWRAASVDALLIGDSRYAVEGWLRHQAGAPGRVAAAERSGYMPRFTGLAYSEIAPTKAATLAAAPDYLVVNVEFVRRFPADSAVRTWLAWLESPDSPYVVVLRHKTPLYGSALAFWPIFLDRDQNMFTNLDKANPEIVVFRGRAVVAAH